MIKNQFEFECIDCAHNSSLRYVFAAFLGLREHQSNVIWLSFKQNCFYKRFGIVFGVGVFYNTSSHFGHNMNFDSDPYGIRKVGHNEIKIC